MPSIGKDLVKIRKHLGLTLQDIQFATKLPQHTLEKIEDDTIFVDAEEGPIYTRNFVRSYGRVLKIDDDLLIEALNLREGGLYDHELLRDFPELSERPREDRGGSEPGEPASSADTQEQDQKKPEKESDDQATKAEESTGMVSTAESEPEVESRHESESESESEPEKKTEHSGISQDTPESKPEDESSEESSQNMSASTPGTPAGTPKKNPAAEKKSDEVDWAKFGQKIHQEEKQLPAWVIGLIILIIILGAAGYFVFQSGLLSSEDSPDQEITTPASETAGNSLSIELDEPQSRPQPEIDQESQVSPQPVVTLDDTLNIVVYAAFGNVDPVRVWSDTKPRFDPYWIEEGNAMTFDFVDSVQVRGPYDNMLVFMNGHLIENMVQNFYSDEGDYVELNRSDFTSDTKWSETTDLQVPEDVNPPLEIRSRPTFN
jgi:hypothetical protein